MSAPSFSIIDFQRMRRGLSEKDVFKIICLEADRNRWRRMAHWPVGCVCAFGMLFLLVALTEALR